MKKKNLEELYMIIVVRGDIVSITGVKMPDGMAAAQACHAAGKLIACNIYDKRFSAFDFADKDFTKIVLRARDNKELEHIQSLASKHNLLDAEMLDTNEFFHGKNPDGSLNQVRTAIAIGPAPKESFAGITDYLPLY